MRLNTYLSFDGNCREALEFYAAHVGGKITAMMTYGEMPGCEQMPAQTKTAIMHGCLDLGAVSIMGTDGSPGHEHENVRGAHLVLDVPTPAEAERLYAVLVEGGTVCMPIGPTFWAQRYGILIDRFGVPWMINCSLPAMAA